MEDDSYGIFFILFSVGVMYFCSVLGKVSRLLYLFINWVLDDTSKQVLDLFTVYSLDEP